MTPSSGRGRVLVTGAGGFIGRHLQEYFRASGREFRCAVRAARATGEAGQVSVGDIGPDTDWRMALEGVESVVHLAGRAHVLRETAQDPRAEFMRVNVAGTARLAAAASAAGVRRFVFLSSVGVLGNSSRQALTEQSPPRPHNAYAESKLLAEAELRKHAGSMDFAIVRPPLVYGSHVPANFLRLLSWVDRGVPLPLASVHNSRSMVSVWNLCDFIGRLLDRPEAAGRAWLVADSAPVSTPELIIAIARHLGRPASLWPFPPALLEMAGRLPGPFRAIQQLCGSLTVDIGAARRDLGWEPPHSLDDSLRRTVQWFESRDRTVRSP